jgi:L-alanine-DL-glutamate epimerase-like enolase superfamily enzyme
MSGPRLMVLTPHLYRVPLQQPVVTSFGTMRARWALWVSVQDTDGVQGWGEVWCNFPDSGALHRCRLLLEVYVSILEALHGEDPTSWSTQIAARTNILRLQSAEFGPLDQCAAGLDTALWDLYARRLGQPLHRVLRAALDGGTSAEYATVLTPRVRAYASGINPTGAGLTIARAAQDGHRAFKVKIGFHEAMDIRTLEEAREAAGDRWLAADANQGWNREQAVALLPQFERFQLAWMEEPIAADSTNADWQSVHAHAPMPLAAGENINHLSAFKAALQHWGLGVMQPDLAKWGGFTGCLEVVRHTRAQGVLYCPHYLGGGIGLLASAHLLAASGQDGLLEMDVNPNPLRTEVLAGSLALQDGWVGLTDSPGLGLDPDLPALRAWAQPLPT